MSGPRRKPPDPFGVSTVQHGGESVRDNGEPAGGVAASRPQEPDVSGLAAGLVAGDRASLARAISLVESTSPRHAAAADELLHAAMSRTREPAGAVRVGITGAPGAGKSTLIERLGLLLCEQGRRVAVLAIDPSSAISGGSILGDRTRMGRLSTHPLAYIRPSPSGGTLGGVARRTREASILCEAAGFEIILIETVGVGQSETLVADIVDCVLTLALPNAGDELQGVKRGLLEVVDVLAVNKADGENLARARESAAELTAALRVLRGPGAPPVSTCSAATGQGVREVWRHVEERLAAMRSDGTLEARRRGQALAWMRSIVQDRLRRLLDDSPDAAAALERARRAVLDSRLTPAQAASQVIEALIRGLSGTNTG